jgi:hypothetical protein
MATCPVCGAAVISPDSQKFCAGCGKELLGGSGEPRPNLKQLAPPNASQDNWVAAFVAEQLVENSNPSRNAMRWPRACACCLGPAERQVAILRSSRSTSLPGVTTRHYTFWPIPACTRCSYHHQYFGYTPTLVLAASGAWLIFGMVVISKPGATIVGLVIVTVALLIGGPAAFLMKRRRDKAANAVTDGCSTLCKAVAYKGERRITVEDDSSQPKPLFHSSYSPKPKVVGHNFIFANPRYAALFIDANGGNLRES